MKREKIFFTTGLCLLPIVLGIRLYAFLPNTINMNLTLPGNTPNMGFNKTFVILLPLLYAGIHYLYFTFRDKIVSGGKDIITVNQWLFPLFSQIMSIIILINSLNSNNSTTIYLYLSAVLGIIVTKVGLDYKNKNNEIIHNYNKYIAFSGYIVIILGYIVAPI